MVYHVERGFDWNQLALDGASLSLFSSRRLLELRLGAQKPGKAGGDALCAYTENLNPDNILLISTARLDRQAQQTRWFKAVDKSGVVVQVKENWYHLSPLRSAPVFPVITLSLIAGAPSPSTAA